MKKHNQEFYLKMVARCLEDIKMTPKENGGRFLILKKKAKKYLELAKSVK